VNSRGRLAWLLAGVAATVIAIATAGTSLWYLVAYHPDPRAETEKAVYTGEPTGLAVTLADGDITITSGPAGRIEVTRQLQWTGTGPGISERWTGRTLTITQTCPSGFTDTSCQVDYTVAVPAGVSLTLVTYSGDIKAADNRSPQLLAEAYSGDVWLGFAAGPRIVRASTDSGDVTIRVPRGASYTVQGQADGGNSTVDVDQNPPTLGYISATSDDGDITVGYN
jgi:hypothetical protein